MVVELAQVPAGDAEQLGGRFGTGVAITMLSEGLVSPREFFCLCAEAAGALDNEGNHAQRCHRPDRKRGCTRKGYVSGRSNVAVGSM